MLAAETVVPSVCDWVAPRAVPKVYARVDTTADQMVGKMAVPWVPSSVALRVLQVAVTMVFL
jgi:hypothetical protein